PHRVGVAADGFLASDEAVILARGERGALVVRLARDPSSPVWERDYRRFSLELSAAGFFSPGFGGDIAGGCGAGCTRAPGLGGVAVVRGGYAISPLVSFGIAAGFAGANQTIAGRATALAP